MFDTTGATVQAELAALEDPKIRAVYQRHGDDHGAAGTRGMHVVARGAEGGSRDR